MREHDAERLVAGHHRGRDRDGEHGAERRDARGQAREVLLDAVEQARALEDPRVARREADDHGHVDHGDESAAIHELRHCRLPCRKAPDGVLYQVHRRDSARKEAHGRRGHDARAHGAFDAHAECRQHQHEQGRNERYESLVKIGRKRRDRRAARRAAGRMHARNAKRRVDHHSCSERQGGRAHHGLEVAHEVGARYHAHQERARGERAHAVAEVGARENGATDDERVGAHRLCHGHADHAHGGRGAERGARQKRHDARENERRERRHSGRDERRGHEHDLGHRARGTPERREDTDEDEGREHALGGRDALKTHADELAQVAALVHAVSKEQHQADRKRNRNGKRECHADNELDTENDQNGCLHG